VNQNQALRGGIDLGGTKIQTAVVDEEGKVVGEARHPTCLLYTSDAADE